MAALQKDLGKRWANQSRAVVNLFKGPNAIEDVAATLSRLESGDLKLRVRALEAERALGRVQAWQRVVSSALVTSTLVNVGTVLSVSAMGTGAALSFAGAGLFGLMLLGNYLKARRARACARACNWITLDSASGRRGRSRTHLAHAHAACRACVAAVRPRRRCLHTGGQAGEEGGAARGRGVRRACCV